MISAKEALDICKESQKADNLEMYEKLIKEAAQKGFRKVRVEYHIPNEQVKSLRELGFDVVCREDEENSLSTISW